MANPVFDLSVSSLLYTDQVDDFRTLASRLIPEWDNTNANDPVVYLAELYLAALHQDLEFANRIANEFALQTSRDRRSVYAHAKRLGYVPSTRQPATALIDVDVTSSPVTSIPAYSMVIGTSASGEDQQILFENVSAISVPGGTTTISAQQFAQGRTVSDSWTSAGTPFQRFRLTSKPILIEDIIAESLDVQVNSASWTRVAGFGDSGPSEGHFVIDLDFDGVAFLVFGDGVKGAIPPVDQSIYVSYRIGGGVSGNVDTNTINSIVTAPSYVTDVDNAAAAVGGADEETLQHIRVYAPSAIRDAGQLNTTDAITAYLESKPSIARAKTFVEFDQVAAVVLVDSGYNFSTIKPSVVSDVTDLLVMGFTFDLLEPAFVAPTVTVNVYHTDGYLSSDIQSQTVTAIEDWLDPEALNSNGDYINGFGQNLRLSELGFRIKEITGVWDYEIVTPTANVDLEDTEMPTKTGASITVNPFSTTDQTLTSTSYISPASEASS